MNVAKIKKIIKVLMPTLLVFNYFILFDYYVLPSKTETIVIKEKYRELRFNNFTTFYVTDISNKEYKIDYFTFISCEPKNELIIKKSSVFHNIKSFEIASQTYYYIYDLHSIFISMFFISILFLGWLFLKKLHEYLYYIFFIPYIVLNLFIWGYLVQFKY